MGDELDTFSDSSKARQISLMNYIDCKVSSNYGKWEWSIKLTVGSIQNIINEYDKLSWFLDYFKTWWMSMINQIDC